METNRFSLRELREDDAPEIYELRSSDTVNQLINRQKATCIEDAQSHISKLLELKKNHDLFFWVICLKDDESLIGTVLFWNVSKEYCSAEIGYELLPAWHGRGVMQEVLPVVLDFGFEQMEMKCIEAEVHRENIKSVKLLEKNGFVKAGSNVEVADLLIYKKSSI